MDSLTVLSGNLHLLLDQANLAVPVIRANQYHRSVQVRRALLSAPVLLLGHDFRVAHSRQFFRGDLNALAVLSGQPCLVILELLAGPLDSYTCVHQIWANL